MSAFWSFRCLACCTVCVRLLWRLHALLSGVSSVGMEPKHDGDPAEDSGNREEIFLVGIGEAGFVIKCKRADLPAHWTVFFTGAFKRRQQSRADEARGDGTADTDSAPAPDTSGSCVAPMLLSLFIKPSPHHYCCCACLVLCTQCV